MKTKLLSLFALSALFLFTSCKPTVYLGQFGQQVNTQVELKQANFKVLGSFVGQSTARKSRISIKKSGGVIAAAKADLIKNAEAAGVKLTGSRTMINVTVDVVENINRVTCVVSAEIIEFQ